MSFNHREAYIIEECSFYYLCFNKACFQLRLEIDFYKVKCSSNSFRKFSIESSAKVLSSEIFITFLLIQLMGSQSLCELNWIQA